MVYNVDPLPTPNEWEMEHEKGCWEPSVAATTNYTSHDEARRRPTPNNNHTTLPLKTQMQWKISQC